uniref:Uncharacterized protein n=1 Tax=Oreochromis niloticus TaxID=8128 RepID=A0A669B7J0_ORENI
ISPLSNTAAIFVSGFSTASFSFLASNRGLYSKIGRRLTNEGTSRSASHIFSLASGSGNWGSSGSTTMCFFSRVQPLSLLLRPFGFWAAFCSLDEGDISAATSFLSAIEDAVDVTDFVEASTIGVPVGAAGLDLSTPLPLSPVFWDRGVVGVHDCFGILHTLLSGIGEGLVTVLGLCGTSKSLVASLNH